MSKIELMKGSFIIALTIKLIVQFYLSWRNMKNINRHKDNVPARFTSKITLEEHQKAASYSISKEKLGLFFLLIETIVLLAYTFGGGFNLMASKSLLLFPHTLTFQAMGLFAIYSLISLIIGIPESLYSTFVLEEKYGFNKTTYKTFFVDFIKQISLGLLIGVPIFLGLVHIMRGLGDYWWLWGFVFTMSIQFVLLWAYPSIIAPIFNKFSPLEDGEVKDKIMDLANRTDFNCDGIFIMDASKRSSHGNAYFTGLGKKKRIVFFDTLIKILTPDQIEAVLAHELGHFKKKHILKGIMKGAISSFIGFFVLGVLSQSQWFYFGLGVSYPSEYMALILFTNIISIYTFFLIPINSFFSRKHEFEADAFAAKFSNSKELVDALIAMYKDNASTLTPDPVYSKFYHSHPPAFERISHLETI
ncbi:M48 family metallopeptidase [Bacteriovoracaceae bacterium]|nr:M48 family metallopeptidase [Bacteriovoracaceae bacterium]